MNKKLDIKVKMAKQKVATFLSALLLLGGCATVQAPATDAVEATTTEIPKNWQLSGKIGLTYPQRNCGGEDCRTKSDQGKIIWRQQQNNYIIRLNDPFERLVMRLAGDKRVLKVSAPSQESVETTPENFIAVMARDAGNPSLSALNPTWVSYWITGRPSPSSTVSEQTANSFVQEGYQITSRNWKDTEIGKLPSLVIVKKNKFMLRLAISEWIAPDGTVL